MPKTQVLELSSRPDFSNLLLLNQYLKEHPDGDAVCYHGKRNSVVLDGTLTGNTVNGQEVRSLLNTGGY